HGQVKLLGLGPDAQLDLFARVVETVADVEQLGIGGQMLANLFDGGFDLLDILRRQLNVDRFATATDFGAEIKFPGADDWTDALAPFVREFTAVDLDRTMFGLDHVEGHFTLVRFAARATAS